MKNITKLFMIVAVFMISVIALAQDTVAYTPPSEAGLVNANTNSGLVIDANTIPVDNSCGLCIEFYILALVGLCVHLLMKWRDSWTQKEVWDWKRQAKWSIVSVLTSFVIIYLRDYLTFDIGSVHIEINPLTAFFVGYFADSLWKNLEGTMREKMDIPKEKDLVG